MKKLILFIFIILLFQVTEINSFDPNAFTCSVKASCNANENIIFYMYNNVDTHVSTTNTNWPYRLCCTKMINSCGGLYTTLFKLYLSPDGHASISNSNYLNQVCLSVYNAEVGQGAISCSLKPTCSTGEQCIVTLSSSDDAHVSACGVSGSYSNELCCGATVCPEGFGWNEKLNNGKGGCEPAFGVCYTGDRNTLTSDEGTCKDKWRTPTKQDEPYWRDAVNLDRQDCFDSSSGVNILACCPLTPNSVYNNKEYGTFEDIIVKKCTVEQINAKTC
jgi:hypothetical protein